jgi:hypothetical protein
MIQKVKSQEIKKALTNFFIRIFKNKIIFLVGFIVFVLFLYFIIYTFNTYNNYSVLWNIPTKYKIENNGSAFSNINNIELSPNEKGDAIGGIINPIIGLIGVLLTFLAFYVQFQANNKILNFDEEKKLVLNKKIIKSIIWELEQVYIFLQYLNKEYDSFPEHYNKDNAVDTFNTYIAFEMEIFNKIDFIYVIDLFKDEELENIYKIRGNIEIIKKNIPLKLNEIINGVPKSEKDAEINKIVELIPTFKKNIDNTMGLIKPIVLKYNISPRSAKSPVFEYEPLM